MADHQKPHRGVLVLVFGILGFLVCIIFAILAWVWGNTDLKEMDAGRMDPSGRGLTSAGKILGMIAVILNIVVFLMIILGVVSFGTVAAQ